MGISSPGIGSNLDINGIISKLMQAESQPLVALQKKEASYQAKLSAFGTLSGSLGGLQSALGKLNKLSTFTGVNATTSDSSIFNPSASSSATAGSYNINVTQLAQAQTLFSSGQASTTATIGSGASTTLTFQFGTISGGNYVTTGSKLGSGIASGGIPANSLSINGTTIVTSGSTTSAKALADQINLANATTGVTATAQTTDTGSLGAFTTTSGAATYKLDVGGINIIDEGALGSSGTTAADLDAAITSASGALAAAGISFSGTAAGGNLKFTKADGSNITIQESGAGAAGGFASSIGIGTTQTFTGSVSLSSANAITVGGSAPSAAGFTAGTASVYSGAGFALDPNQPAAAVTIDNTNNSLQGIRDAINKANIGVTASIVSDGSSTPDHLVIKSNKTGATSSMKISVAGDAALSSLLAYDPAGAQNMSQSTAAQSAMLSVNGIAVSSDTNTVSGAIEGVTLNLSNTGSANLNLSTNTAAVTSAVNDFVKAYNDLNTTIKNVTSYNADTKQGGILLGDSSVRNIQSQLRRMMASPLTGTDSSLTTLSQIGISINKDGVMSLDSGKLSTAMSNKMTDVAALFSSVGTASDSLVKFDSATSASAAGTYNVFVTSLATQGKVTGSNAVAATTVIDNSNKSLTLTVDGTTASVSLPAGSYTAETLVTQLQSTINSASSFSSAGIAVKVALDASNKLVITSNKYGSESKVTITGNGVATLMGTATATDGADIAGTIAGVPATGSGQYLTGASGSPGAGLKLLITGGAENASRGTVTFSHGYAHNLNGLLDGFLGSSGVIGGRTDGINRTIKDIQKQNDTLTARLADTEDRYRKQFTALDTLISKMNATSTYLTQQLAQISATSKSS
ncbi:MAG TPA: flagellar filament capping protein FliD [Noviherbaspirillum sp.]|nr:flagellar filament capping protein FliD [Noviherbaspirillum sp.]